MGAYAAESNWATGVYLFAGVFGCVNSMMKQTFCSGVFVDCGSRSFTGVASFWWFNLLLLGAYAAGSRRVNDQKDGRIV